ncbi:hypothetical protein MJ563_20460 [Klebsiella pneumoniae]|nr:hypothetical protein MJ563_20460 [Klebsiella pneumoniae]
MKLQLTLKPESWQQTLPGKWRRALNPQSEKPPRTSRCWIIRNILPNKTPPLEPAIAPALPEAIHNGDELSFYRPAPEQYNHASRYAGDYYRRAVELDPQDYRNNAVALGTWRSTADWALAEQCARVALQRAMFE